MRSSKANILKQLRGSLRESIIDEFLVFTFQQWQSDKNAILRQIKSSFSGDDLLIVRSSCLGEDSLDRSLAGFFHSERKVSSADFSDLDDAIKRVIDSYSKNGRFPFQEDEIIIQRYVQGADISGVVMTMDPRTKGPYYTINYDISGKTNQVTKGLIGTALRITRWQDVEKLPYPWNMILRAVQEIENSLKSKVLDIEFCVGAFPNSY